MRYVLHAKRNRSNHTKKWAFVIVLMGFGLLIYSIKSFLGIDLLPSVSFSEYSPFKYLVDDHTIHKPKPGVLVCDDFEKERWLPVWSSLWMSEEGKANKSISSKGRNNSKCLYIISHSNKSWVCAYDQYIKVKTGDVFSFDGWVHITGDKPVAYVALSSYDANKKVLNYEYDHSSIETKETWVHVQKRFQIGESPAYIRLRLTGTGQGEYHFDDVRFTML